MRRPMPAYRYRPHPRLEQPDAVITPTFAGLGEVEADVCATYPRHRHGEYEIIVPFRGGYRCRLNSIELGLGPGEVLLIKPGDWHEDLLVAGGRHLAIWFHLRLAGDAGGDLPLFAQGVLPEQQVVRPDGAEVRRLAADLQAEYGAVDLRSGPLQDALVAVLVWRLVRAFPPDCLDRAFIRHGAEQAFATRLLALFRRRAGGPLPVKEMAAALGLSERTLSERCRRLIGRRPSQFHADWRLDRAAELLRGSGLPVKDVAERLGFANPFHFARAFRRRHGMPPSACRSG